MVEDWVVSNLGGTANLEKLDYRLWRGEVVVRGLSLKPESRWTLAIPTATLQWIPWSGGATLRVLSPSLVVFQGNESPDSNDTETVSPALPALLTRIEIQGGSVQVRPASTGVSVELSSIDVELDHENETYEGWLQTDSGRVGEFAFGPVTANIRGGSDRLVLEEVRAEKDSSHLHATGAITSISPFVAQTAIDFSADAEILNELEPDLDLVGNLTGKVELAMDPTDLSGSIEFSSPRLSSPLGTWSIETSATLLSGAVEAQRIHLEGYGGVIDAEGRLDFDSEGSHLDARFEGLELGTLLEQGFHRDLPIHSRADGEIHIRWTEWNRRNLSGEGRLRLEPSPRGDGFRGGLELTSQNGTLWLETKDLLHSNRPLGLRGELRQDGTWNATYSAENLDVHQFDVYLQSLDLPPPPLDLRGEWSLLGQASGSLSDVASTTSNLRLVTNGLAFRGASCETEAELRVAGGELHIDALVIRGDTGNLSVQGSIGEKILNVTGRVENFEVAELATSVHIPIQGRIEGRFDLSGPLDDPDLSVRVRVSSLSYRELAGDASLELIKQGRNLYLDRFAVRSAESTGTLTGRLDLESQEVDLKLDATHWRLSHVLPDIGLMDAVVSANGTIQGKLRAPVGDFRFHFDEFTLRGEAMPAVFVEAQSDGHNLVAEARLADGSTVASGRCNLETPYRSQLTVQLESLPMLEVLHGLFPSTPDDTELAARGELEVSSDLLHLDELQYRLRVDQLTGTYHGIVAETGSAFTIEGDRRFFAIDEFALVATDSILSVSGRVPLVPDERFDLSIRGEARLELLRAWLEEYDIQGEASLDLGIKGLRTAPAANGMLHVDLGAMTWQGIRATDISLLLEAKEDTLQLREMSGRLLDGTIQLSAEWPFFRPVVARTAKLTFAASEIDLGQLIQTQDSAIRPLLRVSAKGSIQLPELGPETFVGSGEIHQLQTSLGDLALRNEAPVGWSIDNGRVVLTGLHVVGGETDLLVDAAADVTSANAGWQLNLRGVLDDRFVDPLLMSTADATLSGTTHLDLMLKHTSEGPRLDGVGSWDQSRLVLRDPPLVLTNFEGEARFEGKTVTLANLQAEAEGGSVRGAAVIELAALQELSAVELELAASSISLPYPEGMQSRVSGDLRLVGSPERYLLSGEVRLLEGLYQRELTLETELLEAVERHGVRLVRPETSVLQLDIAVRTVEDFRIENRLAQMAAGANLRITGTLSEPELDGVLTARPEGTFRLGRNRYTIDSGTVLLRGYPLQPAELDFSAGTSVSDTDIKVKIRGPVDNIELQLEAPERDDLTRADIASLLVTGRTLTTTDGFENVSGQQGRILGEQLAFYLGGALTQVVRQGLGQSVPLDIVSVGPDVLGTEVDPQIRFTIGKAVTEELFVTYSVGLENAQNQLWIFDYKLPKQLAVRATRKEDNELNFGLSQKLHLDFPSRPERSSVTRKRQKISDVRLEGSPENLESALADELRLQPGREYDYWKSREDSDRLTRSLRDAGYLDAVVNIQTSTTNSANIDVTYRINPGNPLRIEWQGEDPGSKIRRRIEQRWDGRFPEDFQLRDLAARTERLLQVDRYYTAEVTSSVGQTPDGTRQVSFDVFKGQRGRRVLVLFEGNRALTDRELERTLPSSSSGEFFDLIYGDAQRLRENLRMAYASHGYLQSTIGTPIVGFRSDLGELQVTVPVTEGPRTNVAEIDITGAHSLDRSQLVLGLKTKEGEPFRLNDVIEDRSAIASTYRRAGFPESETRLRVEFQEEKLRVRFEVDEGKRVTIGRVRVRGNHGVSEDLILRQANFRVGEPLELADLTETQRRLYELGVFRSADVRAEPSTDNPLERDVVIEVNETADFDVGYGLRYSTEERFELTGTVGFPHVFGSAGTLGMSIVANANRKIARGIFSNPYFFRYRVGTDLVLTLNDEDEETFDGRDWIFTFQQTKELAERLDVQWSYTFKHKRFVGFVGDSPFPFDFTNIQSILTTSVIRDTRDKIIEPSRGRFWTGTFQWAPAVLRSDTKFVKLFGQLNAFFTLSRDLVWASSYRLGIADFDLVLFDDERFRAGGATTVRGFEQDGLGPGGSGNGAPLGGEGLVVFNQELRFPLYRLLRGVIFYDAGNVFLNASDFRLFDLRHSAGAGLRVSLPFVLLRFDWAWVLDPQPGEKTYRFWFNLNHAF
jgi:outer membrane protein insertion porin family